MLLQICMSRTNLIAQRMVPTVSTALVAHVVAATTAVKEKFRDPTGYLRLSWPRGLLEKVGWDRRAGCLARALNQPRNIRGTREYFGRGCC